MSLHTKSRPATTWGLSVWRRRRRVAYVRMGDPVTFRALRARFHPPSSPLAVAIDSYFPGLTTLRSCPTAGSGRLRITGA